MLSCRLFMIVALSAACFFVENNAKRREDSAKCPHVKAIRNFDIHQFLGSWYVVQYYASSEEELSYGCMRPMFFMSDDLLQVSMNFTYTFTSDPDTEILHGNITWDIPNPNRPSHWVHAEDTYEGVYNTYVLDSDYKSWALLLHCAEKSKSSRYLSSFIMSRKPTLTANVISYLRDKILRYDIDVEYMFTMSQNRCSKPSSYKSGLQVQDDVLRNILAQTRGNPMKRKH